MHAARNDDESLARSIERMGRSLGRAYAIAREELDMTVEEVALEAHVAPATVRRVEAGEIAPFTLSSLERIGRALGLDLELDFVPQEAELLVLASSVEAPVHVFVRLPAIEPADEPDGHRLR